MFYSEEEIQPVVQVATELFGPAGNMMEGKHVFRNLIIGTHQYGKVWYGDVDGNVEYIKGLLQVLSQRTGIHCFSIDENF